MPTERPWKRRTLPPTTCDQCECDYAADAEQCVRVLVDHPLEGETICFRCASKIGITGCRFLHWGAKTWEIPYVLGTAPPPDGWPHPKPTPEEILRALSSSGYLRQPVPDSPARLDFALDFTDS